MAAESAPVPKKQRLSLSFRKRLGRLARDQEQRMAIAQVMKSTKVQTLCAVAGAWPGAYVRGNYYTHAHR